MADHDLNTWAGIQAALAAHYQKQANRDHTTKKVARAKEVKLPQRPAGPVLTDHRTWSNYYETRFQTRNPAPKWGDTFQHPDDGTRPHEPFMDMRQPDPDDYEESVIGWNAWQQKAQETVEVAAWMRENDVQISFSRGQGIAYVVVNGEPFTVELGAKDDEGSIQARALKQCRQAKTPGR